MSKRSILLGFFASGAVIALGQLFIQLDYFEGSAEIGWTLTSIGVVAAALWEWYKVSRQIYRDADDSEVAELSQRSVAAIVNALTSLEPQRELQPAVASQPSVPPAPRKTKPPEFPLFLDDQIRWWDRIYTPSPRTEDEPKTDMPYLGVQYDPPVDVDEMEDVADRYGGSAMPPVPPYRRRLEPDLFIRFQGVEYKLAERGDDVEIKFHGRMYKRR